MAVAGATSPAVFDRPLAKPQLLDDAVLEIRAREGISAGEGITEGERTWGIQVGAYRSSQPALAMATMASATVDELLRPGKITVVERNRGSRTFYLARVHDLTRSSAEAACAKLRQTAIDCLIIELVDETQAGWDVGPVTAELRPAAGKPEAGGSLGHGDWGIQVGAFPAKKQARSIAQKAVRALPETLEPAAIKIVPLSTEKRGTVYRARLVGIEKSDAYQACQLLSLQRFGCMVLRVNDQSVASAG
jgi:D-alanyl-D-alanine carboxypeptidase